MQKKLIANKLFNFGAFIVLIVSLIIIMFPSNALFLVVKGHGYVAKPYSRAVLGQMGYQSVGNVMYEPQSIEAPKGFPDSKDSPPDGKIASGNGKWSELDEQSSTRWVRNNVHHGDVTFTWTLTAAHVTSKWEYWLTKQGWDQNAPLARNSFELIKTIPDGTKPESSVSQIVTIPNDRTGYHAMLAIWEIGDTGNSFYNMIDLQIDDSLEAGGLTKPDGSGGGDSGNGGGDNGNGGGNTNPDNNKYNVTFDLQGGNISGSTGNIVLELDAGDYITAIKPNPTKTGYEFDRWTNSDGSTFIFDTQVYKNITIYAAWILPGSGGGGDNETNKYNVTFDLQGGNINGSTSNVVVQLDEGSHIMDLDTNPNKSGYNFEYWINSDGSKFEFHTAIHQNITIYALWSKQDGTVVDDRPALPKNTPPPDNWKVGDDWPSAPYPYRSPVGWKKGDNWPDYTTSSNSNTILILVLSGIGVATLATILIFIVARQRAYARYSRNRRNMYYTPRSTPASRTSMSNRNNIRTNTTSRSGYNNNRRF